ncbi:MAG: hypothetical protein AAF399_13670 [Bacteroidota bacterium]
MTNRVNAASWISSLMTCLMLLGIGCTVPQSDDFQSTERPLEDGEYLTIWRFHRYATPYEVLDPSDAYAERHVAAMEPMFQQMFPRIFQDLKSGKLILQKEEDLTNLKEEAIADLSTHLAESYGGSWQNLDPYTTAFHITQRRTGKELGFPAEELEMMLIATDPEGQLPERYLGSIPISDLARRGHKVKTPEGNFTFQEYLSVLSPHAYPIYFENQYLQNGLRSLEQAFATKEYVLNGKWDELEWLGGEPNFSPWKKADLSISALQQLVGTYTFSPDDDQFLTKGEAPIQVDLIIEEAHLRATWPNQSRYFQYLLFPTSDGSFFTVHGDRSFFTPAEKGGMSWRIITADQEEVIGARVE